MASVSKPARVPAPISPRELNRPISARLASMACYIHPSAIRDGNLIVGAELRGVRAVLKGETATVGVICAKSHVLESQELSVLFRKKSIILQLAGTTAEAAEIKREIPQNLTLTGLPVSPGFAAGPASILIPGEKAPQVRRELTDGQIGPEIGRLQKAVTAVVADYSELIAKAEGEGAKALLEAHVAMLMEAVGQIEEYIRSEKCNAEYAVHVGISRRVTTFNKMSDPAFREKALDYQGFSTRLNKYLSGAPVARRDKADGEPVVLVAEEFTPDEVMDGKNIAAMVAEKGGPTSHAAVVAKGLRIPCVLGIGGLLSKIGEGMTAAVNGIKGEVVLNPSPERMGEIHAQKQRHDAYTAKVRDVVAGRKSATADGHEVRLGANLFSVREYPVAKTFGIDNVGLVRTEGDVLNRAALPSEDELAREYSSIDGEVKFRALDLGGDKITDALALTMGIDMGEENPLLGLRGIRLMDHNDVLREVFKSQIRAFLRASGRNPLASIMFPMVSRLHEFADAKKLVRRQMEELTAKRVKFNPNIKIGVMAEVPSVIFFADQLAKEADYINIGTNDMSQYMFAIDRGNAGVAGLYDPYHISLLAGVRLLIEAAHRQKKTVCLCGDMGADPVAVPILVGLGVNDLSMSPSEVPNVKYILNSLHYKQMRDFTMKLFEEGSPLLPGDGKTSARNKLLEIMLAQFPLDAVERITLVSGKLLSKPV
ncbi:MAG: phosphoenolpyruvate--protein phosphotransferase [Candidatus Saganbacteria bacterium]|nr:phosphoenolpyruvate--protein phosphotransferase [Candidatus Saganbacteria bacterium]